MNKLKDSSRKILFSIIVFTFLLFIQIQAQSPSRKEIHIPDILGYKTLKCDFHNHTIFSDGEVWPTVRIMEAWKEGLDVIAITDHIDYLPHERDLSQNRNRSFEIANELSKEYNIIVIKGCEVTKKMPPGHFNTLFIQDINLLDTSDYKIAVKTAKEQGAFIQWNHPFWRNPTFPRINSKLEWFPQHQELFDNGLLNGIEIVNEKDYYPEAFRWSLERNLTILGNSDIHSPTGYFYDFSKGEHRPFTLVFAENKSEEAIKEALFAHRTAVFFSDTLLGSEKFLKAIFNQSVVLSENKIEKEKGKSIYINITNNSDIPFSLISTGVDKDFEFSHYLNLPVQQTVRLKIKPKSKEFIGTRNLILPYKIKNLLIGPYENLIIELELEVKMR